jgi:hypothetical protein
MARTLWVCDLGIGWDLLRPRRADLKRSAPACGLPRQEVADCSTGIMGIFAPAVTKLRHFLSR